MSKKTFMATIIITAFLISLVVGMQAVEVAKANPWFMYHYVTPIPDTIPPAITFNTPTNNSVYSSNDIYINFSITKPQPPASLTAGVTFISFALDGNATVLYDFFSLPVQSLISPGLREFNYSNTSILSEGKHSITVYSAGIVLLGNFSIFSVNSSSTINFTINTTSSPSPSPSPSLTESPTQQPTVDPYQTDGLVDYGTYHASPYPYLLGICAIVLVAVAVGLLVYFRKRS